MDEQSTRQTIGPYQIEAVLGRGGMGVVYRALDPRTGARVALKTVRLVEASRLSQIRREVQALARLSHPGVVRTLDHGVEAGMPWYAMELLEGGTLGSIVTQSLRRSEHPPDVGLTEVTAETLSTSGSVLAQAPTLSAEQAGSAPGQRVPTGPTVFREIAGGRLDWVMGVTLRLCETLAYVHGEGVVHCDLKPGNVFVTPQGKPVLVDFGLAYHTADATGREVLESEVLTGGSARYMAPEQIRGEALDVRCDLYALGCLMFELITGRAPFDGSVSQIVEQHLRRPPPRMSQFVADVPEDLERLVSRLLVKHRRSRMGYARDVAAALARYEPHACRWDQPLPRAHTYLYRPPLVGRQDVLRVIQELYGRLAEQHGHILMLPGESGVGKTRLAFEVARHAALAGCSVVAGGCSPTAQSKGRGDPLEPFRPFLHAVADRCAELGEQEAARLLGEQAALLCQFEPALGRGSYGRLHACPQLPADATRKLLYRAVSDMLGAYAASSPLVLILDDLQWADELSLGLLEHLATGVLRDKCVLVLGLMRSEESSPELKRVLASPCVQTIALQRLTVEDVGRMVAGMLSIDEAPAEFVRYLSERSEGNSFFVAEYLRVAVAEQLLVRDALGQWRLADSLEPSSVLYESLPVPHSLREVVERRVEGLSPETKRIMHLAATVGREFDLGVLQLAASKPDAQILDAIADLVQRHVVEPTASGVGFRFTHDKLRELPYAALSDAERRHNHLCVALALEERQGQGASVDAAALGQHWLEAGENERAVAYLRIAGDQSVKLCALDRAAAQYAAAERAVMAVEPVDTAALSELREKLADALALQRQLEAAQAALERALGVQPAPTQLARARQLRKLGKVYEMAHQHEAALSAYSRAEAEFAGVALRSSQEVLSEWIRLQLSRIWIYYWLARVDDMNATIEAVRPYIDDDAQPLDRTDYYQSLVRRDHREQRYVVDAQTLQYAARALRAAEEAEAPYEIALAHFTYGFGLLFHGDLEAAEQQLSAARALTRELGDATSELRCMAYLALTYRRAGRYGEARKLAEETLSHANAAHMPDYIGVAQACLGWLALHSGDAEEAQRLSQAALTNWDSLSFPYPFQWAGALPCMVVQLKRAPLRNLIQLASKLLSPQLARLPEPIDSALEGAVNAYHDGDQETAQERLQQAVAAAQQLGYV